MVGQSARRRLTASERHGQATPSYAPQRTRVALTEVMTGIRTIDWTNGSRSAQNSIVDGISVGGKVRILRIRHGGAESGDSSTRGEAQ
jgi:hypothetical protein